MLDEKENLGHCFSESEQEDKCWFCGKTDSAHYITINYLTPEQRRELRLRVSKELLDTGSQWLDGPSTAQCDELAACLIDRVIEPLIQSIEAHRQGQRKREEAW